MNFFFCTYNKQTFLGWLLACDLLWRYRGWRVTKPSKASFDDWHFNLPYRLRRVCLSLSLITVVFVLFGFPQRWNKHTTKMSNVYGPYAISLCFWSCTVAVSQTCGFTENMQRKGRITELLHCVEAKVDLDSSNFIIQPINLWRLYLK